MDSITHVLSAALWTEPVRPPATAPDSVYARWRERLALTAAALLPDADGVLGFIDLSLYARYHRVATHSVGGLVVCALVAAWLARVWPERLMLPTIKGAAGGGVATVAPSGRRLLAVSGTAVLLHFLGDWVTAWGIRPFWPFWPADLSLGRVNSLDARLLLFTTLAFGVQSVVISRGRRGWAWAAASAWLLLAAAYVWLRPLWGDPAFV